MRIAVDARIIASSRTGIARYAIGLLKGWSRTFPDDEWIFLSHRDIDLADAGLSTDLRVLVSRFPGSTLLRPVWEQTFLPALVRKIDPPPDIFFSPHGSVLSGQSVPAVTTIQDVAFLRFPKILPFRYRVYWKRTVSRAVRDAARIIAVSRATARDLQELLGAEQEKIRVIHMGVDDAILIEPSYEEIAAIRKEHHLPERFLLFVGTLEPRKNVDLLLDIYEALPRPHNVALVLAGDWGWLSWELRDRVKKMDRPLIVLGHVSMEELACLYRMATILLFPSLYEGFGLPLAEAMATGLPIVASDCSSIPEVVGDAGLLVEPDNRQGFRDAIKALLLDDDLRAAYSRKGRERAKHFTWERAAERTREVFEEVLTRTV